MTKSYRIAVQLFGHLRTFEVCFPTLKRHILDVHDADVFIHTWSLTNHTDSSWYENAARSPSEHVGVETRKAVDNLYRPKGILVEEQGLIGETGFFGTNDDIKISLNGMKNMLYSLYQSSSLRENYSIRNSIDYDFVVSIRPDIFLFEDLDFDCFSAEFLYYPSVSIHFLRASEIHLRGRKFFNYPLAGDCFFFSRPSVSSTICGVYDNFDYYYKEIAQVFPNGVENPEVAFYENMYQHKILPRQYQFYYAIKRINPKFDIGLYPPESTSSSPKSNSKKRYLRYLFEVIVHRKIPLVYTVLKFIDKIAMRFHLIYANAEASK